MAAPIPEPALARYAASTGDCRQQALWELLVILVAVQVWAGSDLLAGDRRLRLEVRSDSRAAIGAACNLRSKCPRCNDVAAELALLRAEEGASIELFAHIPGVDNVWADALSRLSAPDRASVPRELLAVPRASVPELRWRADSARSW